ncbi:hypothetical protein Tco_0041365, partial [Tanacetum coccineum]
TIPTCQRYDYVDVGDVECKLSKFSDIRKRAIRLGKSGENKMDAMRRAKQMFKDEHKGRLSAQEPSWETLRVFPKWDAPYPVPILTVNVEGTSRGNCGN